MAEVDGSSSTSSLTSTSHTLTHAPGSMAAALAASDPAHAPTMLALLDALAPEKRHAFLRAPASIPTASLLWAKQTLDAFAGHVADEQAAAARLRNRKRKRDGGGGSVGSGLSSGVLKIRKLHVDGFETGQIWQQARRIIASTLDASRETLRELEESGAIEGDKKNKETGPDAKMIQFDKDGFELVSDEEGSEEDEAADPATDEEVEFEVAESDHDEEEVSGEDPDHNGGAEEGASEDDAELDDREGADDFNQPTKTYEEDPNGLNDGFFSIDEFNKQSQWFEEQDTKADPYTDQVSDEEDIDWHTDPTAATQGKTRLKKSKKNEEMMEDDDITSHIESDEDEDDEEGGPTFGDMDLNAPEGASDDEFAGGLETGLQDGVGLDLSADDILYKDFFAPPPKKAKKGDKPRNLQDPEPTQPTERDMERAMADVRRDIFDDLSEMSDEDDALSDASVGDPKSRRSAHERRQAKLAEEIRRMEAELVAKRAWTLSGEAKAVDRPMNSLLEEDLDFEHAGKPLPVITEAVSEEIEDLIKRRIIASEFDTVVRRRPNADVPADVRRGLVAELDDTKAKQSLAEMYEEEHVKAANPDSYVSQADEKLRLEEREVERMWRDISAKLDALSSWHYKPRPAVPALSVVADVATVAMEDAQPATAQGVGGGETSTIAPQELYNPGRGTAEKGEVVAKSGLPVARQEMSREDKVRRRRRAKERMSKSGPADPGLGKKALEKRETISGLRKGGVRVINRKGEVLDMDGKKPQPSREIGSKGYKL